MASHGTAILLASGGMKISAEPKPENPRAVPDADIRRDEAVQAYQRSVPPVFFVTSATILAATASIS
jgi:hypothetical protein